MTRIGCGGAVATQSLLDDAGVGLAGREALDADLRRADIDGQPDAPTGHSSLALDTLAITATTLSVVSDAAIRPRARVTFPEDDHGANLFRARRKSLLG